MAERLFVNTKDESPRLFKNDFVDFFSRIPFWVPIVIYLPIIGYFSYKGIFESHNGWLFPVIFIAGSLVWSIAEYIIHRYLFHFHPKGKILKRLHFIFHGVHHDYPQDSLRLVMPPIVSMPLAIFFYFLFYWIMKPLGVLHLHSAFFAGFVAAYLFYDFMHYATHHINMNNRYFKMIKEHHMKHHYKNPNEGFGFTSKLWDKVFDTDFKD